MSFTLSTDSDEAKSSSIMENGSDLLASVVDSLAKAVSIVWQRQAADCVEHCLSTW